MVNEVVYTHGIAQTPWGGVKESGYGRTHGRMGLLELVNPQHIHVNRISFLPDLWWFRYDLARREAFWRAGHNTSPLVRSLKPRALLPQMLRRLFRPTPVSATKTQESARHLSTTALRRKVLYCRRSTLQGQ